MRPYALHACSTDDCSSLRVSAVVGSDLGRDVQAVCAVQAVAGTDSAGAHTLSRERLSTLFHLEGLAGAQQH